MVIKLKKPKIFALAALLVASTAGCMKQKVKLKDDGLGNTPVANPNASIPRHNLIDPFALEAPVASVQQTDVTQNHQAMSIDIDIRPKGTDYLQYTDCNADDPSDCNPSEANPGEFSTNSEVVPKLQPGKRILTIKACTRNTSLPKVYCGQATTLTLDNSNAKTDQDLLLLLQAKYDAEKEAFKACQDVMANVASYNLANVDNKSDQNTSLANIENMGQDTICTAVDSGIFEKIVLYANDKAEDQNAQNQAKPTALFAALGTIGIISGVGVAATLPAVINAEKAKIKELQSKGSEWKTELEAAKKKLDSYTSKNYTSSQVDLKKQISDIEDQLQKTGKSEDLNNALRTQAEFQKNLAATIASLEAENTTAWKKAKAEAEAEATRPFEFTTKELEARQNMLERLSQLTLERQTIGAQLQAAAEEKRDLAKIPTNEKKLQEVIDAESELEKAKASAEKFKEMNQERLTQYDELLADFTKAKNANEKELQDFLKSYDDVKPLPSTSEKQNHYLIKTKKGGEFEYWENIEKAEVDYKQNATLTAKDFKAVEKFKLKRNGVTGVFQSVYGGNSGDNANEPVGSRLRRAKDLLETSERYAEHTALHEKNKLQVKLLKDELKAQGVDFDAGRPIGEQKKKIIEKYNALRSARAKEMNDQINAKQAQLDATVKELAKIKNAVLSPAERAGNTPDFSDLKRGNELLEAQKILLAETAKNMDFTRARFDEAKRLEKSLAEAKKLSENADSLQEAAKKEWDGNIEEQKKFLADNIAKLEDQIKSNKENEVKLKSYLNDLTKWKVTVPTGFAAATLVAVGAWAISQSAKGSGTAQALAGNDSEVSLSQKALDRAIIKLYEARGKVAKARVDLATYGQQH